MSISTGERYQSLFEELNQHYFHGRLRNYRIEIVARDFVSDYLSPATVGLTQVRQKLIQLRKQFSLEMIATLLHEMAHAATPHTGYHHHSWKWRQEIERLRKLGAPIDEPPVLDLNRLTKSFVRHDACDVLWYNLAITPLHFARYF